MTAVPEVEEEVTSSSIGVALVALGELTVQYPELQACVDIVMPGAEHDIEVRVLAGNESALTLWAVALEDSETRAYRWQGKVDGEVRGHIGDVTVRVVAELPDDTVSDDFGWHAWTPAVAS